MHKINKKFHKQQLYITVEHKYYKQNQQQEGTYLTHLSNISYRSCCLEVYVFKNVFCLDCVFTIPNRHTISITTVRTLHKSRILLSRFIYVMNFQTEPILPCRSINNMFTHQIGHITNLERLTVFVVSFCFLFVLRCYLKAKFWADFEC